MTVAAVRPDPADDLAQSPWCLTMRRMVDASAVLASAFFVRLRDAAHEVELLRAWALQDRYTSYAFPRLIAAILAGLEGDSAEICETRIPIAENLWEELGEGDPARAHSSLMDALILSLGVAPDRLIVPRDPATCAMLDTQLELCRTDPVAGLGAFCYGNEYLALREYRPIKEAVAMAFNAPDLRFFDANHEADGRHTRLLENALERLCGQNPSLRERCRHGAEIALALRRTFYDSLSSRYPEPRR